MDSGLLAASLVFIIPMCFTPGPNNVLCAAHGSRYGFRSTMPLIAGMAVGWSILGLFIAGITDTIQRNEEFFEFLGYIGSVYIAYLGLRIAFTNTSDGEEVINNLGFSTGLTLQIANGKAWIHFLILMTTFGGVFGSGFVAKSALVFMNLLFGLPAVIAWAYFGYNLSQTFNSDRSGRVLNGMFGAGLVAVAVWIIT